MRQFFFMIVATALFTSCTDSYENDLLTNDTKDVKKTVNHLMSNNDSIDYADKFGISNPRFGQYSTDVPSDNNFSTYSSDNVIIVNGYTSKEYINSETMVFTSQPVDNRLHPWVYYIQDWYKYIYRFTVPKGATITYPNEFDNSWPTGMKPSNKNLNGYDLSELITSDASGDTYEFSTLIKEVSHNVSGQYLGFTAYLPFRVGNPSTDLVFKYVVMEIEW